MLKVTCFSLILTNIIEIKFVPKFHIYTFKINIYFSKLTKDAKLYDYIRRCRFKIVVLDKHNKPRSFMLPWNMGIDLRKTLNMRMRFDRFRLFSVLKGYAKTVSFCCKNISFLEHDILWIFYVSIAIILTKVIFGC